MTRNRDLAESVPPGTETLEAAGGFGQGTADIGGNVLPTLGRAPDSAEPTEALFCWPC